jgi:hypothetical protein
VHQAANCCFVILPRASHSPGIQKIRMPAAYFKVIPGFRVYIFGSSPFPVSQAAEVERGMSCSLLLLSAGSLSYIFRPTRVHTRISISHPNESHTPGLPAHHPRQTLDDWERSDKYHNSFLLLPDPALEAAAKRNDEQGLPDVAVSPAQGKFLNLLAQSIGAKKILEVGTLGG